MRTRFAALALLGLACGDPPPSVELPPIEPPKTELAETVSPPRLGWPVERVELSERGAQQRPGRTLAFEVAPDTFVLSIADGRIDEVRTTDDGLVEIAIDHGEGLRSVYGGLTMPLVHGGLPVDRGAAIGLGERVVLELHVDGRPVEPLPRLGQPP